jgi:hypothetical protein
MAVYSDGGTIEMGMIGREGCKPLKPEQSDEIATFH